MKNSLGAAIGAALVVSLAVAATSEACASVYDFQFTSPEATASGQFVVDPTNDQVTSISGSVSVNGQPIDAITTILADPSFPSPYNNGPFIYDNTYYAANPVFDVDGILFATAGNPGGSWNLWGNGPDNYSLYEYVPTVGYAVTVTGTFGVSTPEVSSFAVSTPEPSTWMMLLLGFTGLGFAGYRKAKRDVTDLALG
jgi:hypothetical protein